MSGAVTAIFAGRRDSAYKMRLSVETFFLSKQRVLVQILIFSAGLMDECLKTKLL